jgi:micrococcal nuclease
MRQPTGLRTSVTLFILILVSALAPPACGPAGSDPGTNAPREGADRLDDPGAMVAVSRVVRVSRVVDGDTIEIDEAVDGIDEVRLIGVDAPEISHPTYGEQPYGQEAREFTASRLQPGREIALEFDVEKTDRYGRLLAYVWSLDDGAMFNETLLREGYAQVATFPPNVKYENRFLQTQREAREGDRGLWGLPERELCQQTDRGNGIGGGCD